jgi:hypothetical protein
MDYYYFVDFSHLNSLKKHKEFKMFLYFHFEIIAEQFTWTFGSYSPAYNRQSLIWP